MKERFAALILILILSSCGFHSGIMISNAEFDKNTEIISLAFGEAKTVHVLGIGGLNSQTLVRDAREKMYSRFPLKKGQAYANISTDFNTKFFILFFITKVNLTADIVDLGGENKEELQEVFNSAMYDSKRILGPNNPSIWSENSDSLVLLRKQNCMSVKLDKWINSRRALVVAPGNKVMQVPAKNLFLLKQDSLFESQKFRMNDAVRISPEYILEGIVKGVNPDEALIYIPEKQKCYGFKIEKVQPVFYTK